MKSLLQKLQPLLTNVLLGSAFVIVAIGILELTVRLFAPVTDWPVMAYEEGIGLHRAPNQSGTWIVGATGEARGAYHFNAAGWNSIHEYSEDKPRNVLRLAVIGDSYVETLPVDVNKSFPAQLESVLQSSEACSDFDHIEVYAFGAGGAPLSQYLNIMRHVAAKYVPDGYIILITSNDFDQSISNDVFHPHQMTFRVAADGGFEEIEPVPFEPSGIRRQLIRSSLVRYVYGNLQFDMLIDRTHANIAPDPSNLEKSIVVGSLPVDQGVLNELVDYAFTEYQAVARQSGSPLVLLLDADRVAIYDGREPGPGFSTYSSWVNEAATSLNVDVVDLTPHFRSDFQQHGLPFDFSVDFHWNERGHRIAAEAVAEWVVSIDCLQPNIDSGAT